MFFLVVTQFLQLKCNQKIEPICFVFKFSFQKSYKEVFFLYFHI
jgi:hypothetical protein